MFGSLRFVVCGIHHDDVMTIEKKKKRGMRSMQELCFGWVSRGGTLCEPNVFIFVTEKEQNFQENETIALRHFKRKTKKTEFI